MAGPVVHWCALKLCREYLCAEGIALGDITPLMAVGPDLEGSHGYDVPSGRGSIFRKVGACISAIQDTDTPSVHLTAYLCHYIVDSLCVGQIDRTLWGWQDNILDAAGDLVRHKTRYLPPTFLVFSGPLAACVDTLRGRAAGTHCLYAEAVKRGLWRFIRKGMHHAMYRDACVSGAWCTAQIIRCQMGTYR